MFLGKFGRKGQKLGGHTIPSHGYFFGNQTHKTWDRKKYGEARSVKVFETDNSDGVREDDFYKLLGVSFLASETDIKQATRRCLKWYLPDKVQQRTEQERLQDQNYSFPASEYDKATKKFGWILNTIGVISSPMLRTFWNFPIRRCLGDVR